jgi:hypothetical protein
VVANAYNTGMTYNTTTHELTITDGGTSYTVDLTSLLDDADANPTNEIQDLSLAGNTLSLSSDPSTVDLTPYLDNTDNQNLGLSSNTLSITNGNSVSLTPYLDNTDNQTLGLSGNTLSISNGNSVSLATYVNTDNQTLSTSTSGSTVSIGISNGNTISFSNNDADASPTNEIQTLSLSGNNLSISGSGGNTVSLPADLWSLTGSGSDIKRSAGNVYVGNSGSTNSDLYLSGRLVDWDNTGYNLQLDGNNRMYNVLADYATTYSTTDLAYNGSATYIGWNAGAPSYTVCNSCCSFNLTNWSCGIFSKQYTNDCGQCGSTTYHNVRLEVNGGGRASAWFTTSDEKFKTNIMTVPHALDLVMKLRGATYDYQWDGSKTSTTTYENPEMMHSSIGFIAQELQAVIPQAVQAMTDRGADGKETGTTTLAVQYDVVIPILVEAIKDQQKQIDELKKQLATQPK